MTLKATIQKAAAAAFNVVDSLQTTVTIRSKIGEVFSSDTMTNAPVYSSTDVAALLLNYSDREVDGISILATDLRVVLKFSLVELITPSDKVVINGDDYDIVNVTRDPAEATWALQVRK